METFQQPKITSYRQLTEEEVKWMNEIKRVAIEVGELIDVMERCAHLDPTLKDSLHADLRWISIGRTDLQKGFMSLTRAVAKPTSF